MRIKRKEKMGSNGYDYDPEKMTLTIENEKIRKKKEFISIDNTRIDSLF